MIKRYYKEGQRLDVAGLNEITVLIDRSETELTEVGWNCWTPNQDGPPHKHNDKTQLFYVTDGVGKIHLGNDVYDASPGDLAYVPAGLIHKTITTTSEKLCYMLFNVFISKDKEGHATFADHIEKVKQIRKLQAESGKSEVAEDNSLVEVLPGKFFNQILNNNKPDLLDKHSVGLIPWSDNINLELNLVRRSAGEKNQIEVHDDKEQTFFILQGNGTVTVGSESSQVKAGNVIAIPRNVYHKAEACNEDLYYLCLNSYSIT
ncbi:MAG: cupin domain-containing protein [Melioribacteraceae bacterium]|nr:cupin domain-containing protein [Melioribacteraceae bacterium]